MKKLLVLSIIVLTIGLLVITESCGNDPEDTPETGERVTVDIYSFTDFHGMLEEKWGKDENPGAARFIAVVNELMSQSEPGHSLLLSSGDNYHDWEYDPTDIGNLSNLNNGRPVSDLFQKIGLKYSVIGNHEWDWGQQFEHFSQEGGITYLAANIFLKGTDDRPNFCKPYVIETIAGKKFGIVGLTIVEMERYTDTFKYENAIDIYDFRSMGPWLKDMVTDLKTNKGCDAVIALTHQDANSLNDLVGSNDKGFDAIILGHTHMVTERLTYGVPTVQASHYGRGLAKLSFKFDEKGSLAEVGYKSFRPFHNDTFLPSGEVDEEIAALVASYRERMENP